MVSHWCFRWPDDDPHSPGKVAHTLRMSREEAEEFARAMPRAIKVIRCYHDDPEEES